MITPNENTPAAPKSARAAQAALENRVNSSLTRFSRAAFLGTLAASEQGVLPPPIWTESLLSKALVALALEGHERVLEVGSKTGYETAVLSQLAGVVYSVVPDADSATRRTRLLDAQGCHNVKLVVGPGTEGWAMAAPYSAVLVTAGATQVPAALYDQLGPEGRLVIPLGDAAGQLLELLQRRPDGFSSEALTSCHLAMLPGASRRPSFFPWGR